MKYIWNGPGDLLRNPPVKAGTEIEVPDEQLAQMAESTRAMMTPVVVKAITDALDAELSEELEKAPQPKGKKHAR
jgi:hypothetical protein